MKILGLEIRLSGLRVLTVLPEDRERLFWEDKCAHAKLSERKRMWILWLSGEAGVTKPGTETMRETEVGTQLTTESFFKADWDMLSIQGQTSKYISKNGILIVCGCCPQM